MTGSARPLRASTCGPPLGGPTRGSARSRCRRRADDGGARLATPPDPARRAGRPTPDGTRPRGASCRLAVRRWRAGWLQRTSFCVCTDPTSSVRAEARLLRLEPCRTAQIRREVRRISVRPSGFERRCGACRGCSVRGSSGPVRHAVRRSVHWRDGWLAAPASAETELYADARVDLHPLPHSSRPGRSLRTYSVYIAGP